MSLVMCAGLTCTVLFIKMTKPPEALSWGLYPVQFQLCALSSEGKLLTIVDCALFYVDWLFSRLNGGGGACNRRTHYPYGAIR